MKKPIKLIYIVGEGRSGSTLLERMLGQHPQIFAAGELKHIWERNFIENQLCSCKKAFNDCFVWQKITKLFWEKTGKIDPQSLVEAFNKTSRIRHYILRENLKNFYSKLINNVYTHLYTSILQCTKKEFVVDASKHPVFAHILAQNPDIDLYIIHLIRDVRGVAYSWTKKKVRPEIINERHYMPRYSVIRTALSWSVVNKIALDLSSYNNINYLRIYYENLVTKPRETLEKIRKALNLNMSFNDIFLDSRTIFLKINHTVSGNPFRFKVGQVKLYLDDEWQEKLSFFKKIVVRLLTFPIRKKLN